MHQAASIAVETPAEVEPTVEIETPVDEVTSLDSVRLPDTASGLPLIGLLGLVVVSGGVAVRVARP